SAKQLALRIRAVLRRCSTNPIREAVPELRVGDYVLDVESCQAHREGEIVQLTALEFRILHALTVNEGHVVSFRRLVERAWGYDGGDASMLKTHVSHIRKKLHLQPGCPGYIGVVHGVGYYLLRSSQGAA
ncbi:MAG TPA: response regulator transcription factor, partial [Chloroflexota bacterium]|nr:response regulator transcription factor [Chloroflexota bacterium]